MFTHTYRTRFDTNQLQNNVLMTQIRAEKKIYNLNSTQPIFSNREATYRSGKKTYQEILFRPSLSPSAKENRQANRGNQERGCQMLRETMNMPQNRSRSGRRKVDNSYKKDLDIKISTQKDIRPSRKPLGHSPNHQHLRTTINLKWQ